jgi:hypothetical protein
MTRARCAVPFCRRTEAKAAGFKDGGFLCQAHWRLRSPELREAWRRLGLRRRRLPGDWTAFPPGTEARIQRADLEREEADLWVATRIHCIEVAMGVSA